VSLSPEQLGQIEGVITASIRKKLRTYKPETNHMPFHYRLLGKDRMALFSFIQSLNTTFGTSIFEPLGEVLARQRFSYAQAQYDVGGKISSSAQTEIQRIIDEISTGKTPNKDMEVSRIRKAVRHDDLTSTRMVKADICVKGADGSVHFFDIKTAKPNISNFKDFKRTLLEWIGVYLTEHPDANVHSYIAIPYNPYEPQPYERWTLRGMLDLDKELKVAEEFWDFLAGDRVYEDLLRCFERVGLALRHEIDEYFSRFRHDETYQ